MSITKIGSIAILDKPAAVVKFPEFNEDGNSVKGNVKRTVSGTSYKIYPWGANNRLPNEMTELYRSNGDVMNLVQTRADFLFGAGAGFFRKKVSGKEIILEPYLPTEGKAKAFLQLNDLQELVNTQLTYLVESGNAWMNHSRQGSDLLLTPRDSLTVRAVIATKGFVDKWMLCPDWSTAKGAVVLPALTKGTATAPETLFQIKRAQTGQFYYGFPIWWAAAKWIRLANRVPDFHNNGLDTEYNVSKICRVARQYIESQGGDTPEEQDAFRDKFYEQINKLLFNKEGIRHVIFDECEIGVDGKMLPFIEFVNIESTLSGKEYTELYQMAVTAFANASGILSGLAGVSDGKMLGGSGSELRVSAEYQQFYRTPRERQAVESYWNRVIKPELGLPDDVFFGFNNIILETLNKEKSGSSQKSTATGTKPTEQKEKQDSKQTETKK